MRKNHHADPISLSTLADDARALMTATADVAEEKVVEARKRVSAALEHGKDVYDSLRERTVGGAKAVDEAVQAHPYKTAGIALAVGALIGCFLSRRN